MRLELWVMAITCMLIYNAYNDNKYSKMIMHYKKYYKMAMYGLLGIGIYLLFKRDPNKGKEMLYYANNFVKYLPIDKTSMDMLSPIIDMTGCSESSFMESFNDIEPTGGSYNGIIGSGSGSGSYKTTTTKRAVSETKKKFVAANQDWKCGHCHKQLDHTYEIDHKIRLEYGAGNDVGNLVALCRNCHGLKTAIENM
jgi:hypothetical protein